MLLHYFKLAWRNLRKNKVYSILNITGLALGLTCTVLIALWVQDERSYDQFHVNGARLCRVMANLNWGTTTTLPTVPAPLQAAMKKDLPDVKYAAAMAPDLILINANNQHYKEQGYYASPDFLLMFSFPLLHGNKTTALNQLNGIVITQKMAEKYFPGIANPIGKTVKINNTDPFTVTGVLQNIPSNSSLQFDWLIPFDYFVKKNQWLNTWGNYATYMYVMLNPGVSVNQVNAKLKPFLQKESGDKTRDEVFLQTFQDVYLHDKYIAGKPAGGRIEYVRLFSIIAAFVLFIACINFMNLSTARSTRRMKEVGIRKVVGARRSLIILQFLGEAFLLTLFSVGFSLFAIELVLPAFNALIGKSLKLDLSDSSFRWALVSITLITSLVAGSYPAFFLSSFRPVQVLKSLVVRPGYAIVLRKGLVVFQFTLSILLIIGTLIVSQQMNFIRNKNIGIDKEQLLMLYFEGGLEQHANAFKNELLQSPGISAVSSSGNSPIDIDGTSADLDWPGKVPNQAVSISATSVGYDYLATVGASLIAGRDFSPAMADSNNYVINESAVRLMNLKDPVGQQVSFWKGKGHIIGVIKDFHLHSLHDPITPLIFCLQPANASIFLIRTEKGKTQQALTSLQHVFQKYNPDYPFEYHFMNKQYEEFYKNEKVEGDLVRLFAVMAILISCLGLFGLATFTAEQRTKEIGIRKVLGASIMNITALLSKDFMRLVLIAILIASPIAWWAANSWLSGFAYRISIGWPIFALASTLALLIALATVSFQAIKAGLANPIKGLRTE